MSNSEDRVRDEAMLELLQGISKLAPDFMIVDPTMAMAAATIRLRMLREDMEDERWRDIAEEGLPPEGEWYDAYTYAGSSGERIVKELFFDSETEDGVHWLSDGDWDYRVTHWRPRPEAPIL